MITLLHFQSNLNLFSNIYSYLAILVHLFLVLNSLEAVEW
jgi:hypothetical protein